MDLTTAVAEEYRISKKSPKAVDPFAFYARVADRLGYDPQGKKNAALLYSVMKKIPLADVFRKHGSGKGISYCRGRYREVSKLLSSEDYEQFLCIFAYAEDPVTYPLTVHATPTSKGQKISANRKANTGGQIKIQKTQQTGNFATGDSFRITEHFDSLNLQGGIAEIVLCPSANGECRVVCTGMGAIPHTVFVSGGVLEISSSEDYKLLQKLLKSRTALPRISVFLPQIEYSLLQIKSIGSIEVMQGCRFRAVRMSGSGNLRFSAFASGMVEINGGYGDILFDHATVGSLDLTVSSGDVKIRSLNSERNARGDIRITGSYGDVQVEESSVGSLNVTVSSGNVRVQSVRCRGKVQFKSSYGDVELDDVRCRELDSEGSSGDITLKRVIASDSFSIERSYGNVEFDRSDANSITVKTSSGDVTGTLLTPKTLITNSQYGSSMASSSGSGTHGVCRVITNYGNVSINIAR